MLEFTTRHAAARMQQRAIPEEAVQLLLEFGTSRRSNGADSVSFDHAARRRLARELAPAAIRHMQRFTNLYAIVDDDGSLLTVAWRTRRQRRA